MPSDTYILTVSEAGVSVPSTHASTHITGGSDVIPTATSSTSGLMSAAIFNQHVTNTAKVSNITHTGDVTDAAGVLTVGKINGVSMAGLATGIVKNTTGTGAPSIAVAADFPTLNQNTTGTAATATNLAGGSAGSIPYQSGTGTTAMLSAGTAGYVLKSNGSSPPSWEPVSLTSGLSGSLPVSSGGTGAVTLTGILKGNGTSAFTTVTAPTGDLVGTTDAQTLTNKTFGSGTTIGVLGTPSSGTLTNCTNLPIDLGTTGTLPVSRGGSGATTLTGIIKGNGSSAFTAVTAPTGDLVGTTDTQTLTNKTFGSGTTISAIGTPSSGTLTNCTGLPIVAGTTGTLSVARGGTGAAILSGIVKANGTNAFTAVTEPAGDLVGTTATQTLTNKTLGSGTTVTDLGTPNSGTLTNCTGLPIVAGTTGTLPVSRGGSGATTLTGIIKGNGSSAFTTVTAPTGDLVGTTDAQTLTNKTFGSGTTIGVLGTPSSGTLTNCTNLPIDLGTTGTLSEARGGTGQTSYAVGDILFASTSSALSKLAGVATGNALLSGGVGVAPLYGKVGLTTHVSGTLAPANGGTGLTSFSSGGAVYASSGSSLITGTLPISAGGTGATSLSAGFIKSDGTALTSSSLPIPVADGGTGRTSNLTTHALIASGTTTTGAHQLLSNGNSGQILRSSGASSLPTWVDLAASDITSGTLPTSRGGTGLTSFSTNGAVYATSSSAITTGTLPIASGGTGRTTLNANGALYSDGSGSSIVNGTLPVASGGTGITSYTSGGAIFASGTTSLTSGTLPVTAGGTGITSLTNNGAMYVSTFGSVLTGTLPIASGGTGQTTTANGLTIISSDHTVAISSVGNYSIINNTGSFQTGSNMSSGTTNTFAIRNTLSASRNFRITGIVELAVSPITITGVSYTSNVVTVTVSGGHGVPSNAINMPAVISGITFTGTNSNGAVNITYVSSTTFTFPTVGVTAVALGGSPQFVYRQSLGIRLSFGSSGSLSSLSGSESRGLYIPSPILSDASVFLCFEYPNVTLNASQEAAIFVANHTSTNSIIVRRAKLLAEATI